MIQPSKGEEHDKAIAELEAQLTGATGAKIRRVPREKAPELHKPAPIEPPAYKLGDQVATLSDRTASRIGRQADCMRGELGVLPLPLAGEGWGEGE